MKGANLPEAAHSWAMDDVRRAISRAETLKVTFECAEEFSIVGLSTVSGILKTNISQHERHRTGSGDH